MLSSKDITTPKGSIISLVNKLCEKIFYEKNCTNDHDAVKVRFNGKICQHLRNIVFDRLIFNKQREEERNFTVKQRICVEGFKLRVRGLVDKAENLEKLLSILESTSVYCSVFCGELKSVDEIEAIINVLLHLSNQTQIFTQETCEVWRKKEHHYLVPVSSITEGLPVNEVINYEFYPNEIFETSPTFGVSYAQRCQYVEELIPSNVFIQEPGAHTKWFNSDMSKDPFWKSTQDSLYNALVYSETSNIHVKLEVPELSSCPHESRWIPKLMSMEKEVTEDEGFEDADSSQSSAITTDSGVNSLDIWDEALSYQPSNFHTWESKGQSETEGCKPYLSESGGNIMDQLYDMRMNEVCFLINASCPVFKSFDMKVFVRDCLMVLIGVSSKVFTINKKTASFHVATNIRLKGVSPESLNQTLNKLAETGTNYYRINKFTHCEQTYEVKSCVLKAFLCGLETCLQQYRQLVVQKKVSSIPSIANVVELFRDQGLKLKFLADVCMCTQGFNRATGQPKPRFPLGSKLLTYLYNICLQNMNSSVSSMLLYLFKVSCIPYFRYLQQWIYKGKCIDFYKEFTIYENDIYLCRRDKRYWSDGYVLSKQDIPLFLQDLWKDIFVCGKSINLLKLCCPQHYICSNDVEIPNLTITYSLDSIIKISENNDRYLEEMELTRERIEKERERNKSLKEDLKRNEVLNMKNQVRSELNVVQDLVTRAKEALAEKKRKDLGFLKQQMEDAMNRKLLERSQEEKDDRRFLRESLRYEVTTAKIDDEQSEQARLDLIRYYEELTREADLREKRANWIANRHSLKNLRDDFLKLEYENEDNMKKEIDEEQMRPEKFDVDKDSTIQNDINITTKSLSQEKNLFTKGSQAMQSTVQDLMYPPSTINDNVALPSTDIPMHTSLSKATDSTVQDLMYPSSAKNDFGIRSTDIPMHTSLSKATDSTVQDLMYPSSAKNDFGLPSTDIPMHTSISKATDSTVQDVIYSNDNISNRSYVASTLSQTSSSHQIFTTAVNHAANNDYALTSTSKDSGLETSRRVMESTAQNLLYPSRDDHMSPYRSTRGSGAAFQSTIQDIMYTDSSKTKSSTPEISNEDKDMFYKARDALVSSSKTSHRMEEESAMKGILYPREFSDERQQTVRGTRGKAPSSTIENIIYGEASSRVTSKHIEEEQKPINIEDIWFTSQVEYLQDDFNILDEKPCGDFVSRVLSKHTNISQSNEENEDVNDACEILCLPTIIKQCISRSLTTQINLVNLTVVRYFMDDLKIIKHFETLKQFLLMEDGEFSFSLTQQLFEKISSGETPQQLCNISVLNGIMAHSIQSSVYASHSENSQSLSFVLNSVPHVFKRYDVKVFDFIELSYKIHWPVNIIITESCMTKYNRIFAFFVQLKRTAWVLNDVRLFLKRADKIAYHSSQLHKVHRFRHEMNHFVNDIQGYVSNQILHVSWQEFMYSLHNNVYDVDDLHDSHAHYLNKSLFRALLNKKAAPVMKIITDLFQKVLNFYTLLVSSSWTIDSTSGTAVHPRFSSLCSTYDSFRESTCFLLTVITKLVNRGYQPHLEELLLRLNFNFYYGKDI